MIGRLKGTLVFKQPPWIVVDVHGVGYELEAPMSTFYDLPDIGREVALFTHYAQKEDSVSLYGFLREPERRLFRDVQKRRLFESDGCAESRQRCCLFQEAHGLLSIPLRSTTTGG